MKYILLLLLTASSVGAFAQQVTKKKISFDYVQYPSNPVAGVTNYSSTVVLGYQAEIDALRNQYQADLAQAEADYQYALNNKDAVRKQKETDYLQALELHKEQQAAADAQHKEDMKKFREGGFLIGQDAPKRRIVPLPAKPVHGDPQRRYVPEPNYPKEYDVSTLAGQYLVVEGLDKGNDNALQVIATIKPYEAAPPVAKSKTTSKKSGDSYVKVTQYYGTVAYKQPVHVQVIDPSGKTILDEVVGGEAATHTGKQMFSSAASAVNAMSNNANLEQQLQGTAVTANMKMVQQLLNDNFGYPIKKRETLIKLFTHKKMNYPEYADAYEHIMGGYRKLDDRDSKDKAVEAISKATAEWDKAMQEADMDSKKARINKKVIKATHFMLAEGYLWSEEFDKADSQLTKLAMIGVKGKEKKELDELQALLDSRRERIEANDEIK